MTEQLAVARFPDCHGCDLFLSGTPAACFACARPAFSEPGPGACPVCSQRPRPDGGCGNELCHRSDRRIRLVHTLGYQSGPLRRVINDYKYRGVRGWSVILGRLLTGWLDEHLAATAPDLIVANPGFRPGANAPPGHAERVLAAAAAADPAGRWPFDQQEPAAIVKIRPTLTSADAQAWSKRVSGYELRSALRVPDPARIAGKRVLVYDDICTTGTQLDAVAQCLLDQGQAASVDAVVLARAVWRPG